MRRSVSSKVQPGRRPARAWRIARGGTKTLTVSMICVVLLVPLCAGVAVGTLLFVRLPGSLPERKPVFEARPSTVYDAAGNALGTFSDFDLTVPMTSQDVPDVLKKAVVAAEDQRFYQHRGVDPQGVARAAWVSYQGGAILQGGSTITQQYIKNAYLTFDVRISRKLREALLATQLERQMSKDQILFNYLNTIYFGSGAYGAAAAAQRYFGKPVSQLSLSEAATLAGVIPAPTVWSPRANLTDAEQRRRIVLDTMATVGFITPAEAEQAKEQVLWLATDGPAPGPATVVVPLPDNAVSNPYFVDWVQEELLGRYGAELVYRGGLRIETSLDPSLQQLAEAAVAERLSGFDPSVEMAMAVLEPRTGHVRAMVGGRDYAISQVNLATGGSLGMQPGSSFKPFTLAAAFEHGFRPDSVVPAPALYQVPGCTEDEGCTIKNSEGSGYGSASLRTATASSINTAYANLAQSVGIPTVAEMASRLGVGAIDPKGDYGLSLTLGAYEVSPLDMAGAYSTFANQGVRQQPTGIVRVVDKTGRVLEDNTARPGTRVLSSAVATNVTDVLRGVVTSGTGRNAALGKQPAAGKTGTTDNYHDAWFVGYTPQLAAAVWMGHRDEVSNLGGVTGGSHPALAWSSFMRRALAGQPVAEFSPPGSLVVVPDAAGSAGPIGPAGPAGMGPARPTEDTTIRPADAGVPIQTPANCGGPCRL